MSGDVLGCRGWGVFPAYMRRGYGCCSTPYDTRTSPTTKNVQNVNGAEGEKPSSTWSRMKGQKE